MKHFNSRQLECLNPYKIHLWRLPDTPQTPEYQDDSKEILCVFPIFQTRPNDISIEHHIARSACWARRSWLLFTDAMDCNVAMKFYVEQQQHSTVSRILERCHIDTDKDIILFDGSKGEGNPQTHLGKKLLMFNDNKFSDYEWVLQIDSDMMIARPTDIFTGNPLTVDKLPVFQHINNHEKEMGSIYSLREPDLDFPDQPRTIFEYHWINFLLGYTDNKEISGNEWLHRAEELTNPDISERYRNPDISTPSANGGVYIFPAKEFLSNRKDKCEWIARAGKSLQDDEAVFSLFMSLDNEVFSLSHEMDMDLEYALAVDKMVAIRARNKPYFWHVASMPFESMWRTDIDSL